MVKCAYRINEESSEKIVLDKKDKKIIDMLSSNARVPFSTIAKKIRLSKEGTTARVKRLQEKKVILQFNTLFDLRTFSYHTYHVFMVLNDQKEAQRGKFIQTICNHPNTKGVMEYGDRWDVEWILVARSIQEFDLLYTELTKQFPDQISEKHRFAEIYGYKSTQFPGEEHIEDIDWSKEKQQEKVDTKSCQILSILADGARESTYKIGNKVNLSSDAVRYRLKHLHKEGILRRHTLLPNLTLLGYHMFTLCIDVKTFDEAHEKSFHEFILQKPEVLRAVKVLGDWDIMIQVATQDVAALHRTVKEIHRFLLGIITSYQWWGTYREHCYNTLPSAVIEKQ